MATKDDVLRALQDADTPLSGQQLARDLRITRSAVWKAVRALEQEGYRIGASTRTGYRLLESPDILSEADISRFLTQREIGERIEFHPELDSTNIRAKQLAARGAAHGTMVIADSQTAGRGRFSRSFYSPPHSGIYVSFILRPALPADRAVLITSMAAVAAARAVESLAPVDVGIKWVNDLYIAGKKCCGILCEASVDFESASLEYVVAGIGINVGRMVFPPELASVATSVVNECGVPVSRSRLAAELANQLAALYGNLESAAFMAEYRRRSIIIGRDITVHSGAESFPARAEDIDLQGRLAVRRPDGSREILNSGEVSIRLTSGS